MKARYLTAKETRVAKAVAEDIVKKQLDDIATRCQYLWMAAMLDAGLSVKTVNRVAVMLAEVVDRYGIYREEGIADYALCSRLRQAGINVPMTKDEL